MVTLKYSGSNGVREHILRMNDMASQLKGLDMEIFEGFLVHFIMTSLPAQFGPFKFNYNTQKEKWKMSELISMCVQEEERLKSEQHDNAHVAITSPSKGKGKGKGKKFGKGNVQGNKNAYVTRTDKLSSSSTKGSSGPRCHFCKDKGHMRKECHKFREWLEKKGNLSICVCYESYTIDAPLNTWWVDTCATVHITNSLQGFLSVKKLNKGDCNVLVENGEKAQVGAVGTLRLVLESGFNLDLVDTVYVPSMTRNLISVSRLDAYGYSFKFENKGFSVFLYSRVIGSGLLEGNLYKLLLNASFTESLKTVNMNDNGVAERRNRTLMDMVRSMICQSTLPEFLWVEALKTAVHILNRVPSYPERSKGFRFYRPSHTTRIVETRHAVFFEDAEYSGSCTPRIINLEEIQDHVSIHVIQKVGVPLPHREDNDAPECPRNQLEQDEMKRIPSASTVGSFMYAQVCTRPDITYVVGMLGRYQINPGMGHWKAAKKVMRYLQGTKDFMLTYRKSDNLEVIDYSDSDYAGCVDTLKSTSGYVFMLAEGAISWKSAKQSLMASHTMEAEFVACFEASCHGVWLKNFITGLKVVDTISRPLKIFCDNQRCVAAAPWMPKDWWDRGVGVTQLWSLYRNKQPVLTVKPKAKLCKKMSGAIVSTHFHGWGSSVVIRLKSRVVVKGSYW
ncbi:hypothetical protein RJ640_011977 [Escallonia rubra]|uniref:Retrovirus-related Pol polyprotein from transposon TNT 1-94-like beta-barrel domain-containing protein n=1 Tax=Escallonia rubra TaxID=112253 RepID=A0AA88UN75_9ASTE|nr:hypothetical protein RJ640_011977 [Escallonia rubra]